MERRVKTKEEISILVEKMNEENRLFNLKNQKNDRKSAKMNAEYRRHTRNYNKNIKDGISILNNKLDNFDCAIIFPYSSNLSNEENVNRYNKLSYQAIDKGYLDFLINANSKEAQVSEENIHNSIHFLVDYKGFKTLEKNINIWAKEYKLSNVFFIAKEGRATELIFQGDEVSTKDVSSYNKIKACKKYIKKALKEPFEFEDSTIVETTQPTNNMGRWYINSRLKNME